MTDTETVEKQAEEIELEEEEVLDQVAEEQNEEPEQEPAADAEAEQTESEGEETETEGDEEEDGVVVEIEGETPDPEEEQEQHSNPNLVKDLRKQIKERNRRIKELEKKRKEEEAEENPALKPLRKKPTLEDHDYDTGEFEKDLDSWKDEEIAHNKAKAEEETQKKQEVEQWNKTLEAYEERKANFEAPDFEEVETDVKDALSDNKRALIVKYANNPEVVTYAIGKRPELLKKLSEEKDLAQFLADVVNLSNKVSVKSRKVTTSPETKVTNATSPTNAGPDKKRQQLEAHAQATGDRTELIKYDEMRKAKLRKRAKK